MDITARLKHFNDISNGKKDRLKYGFSKNQRVANWLGDSDFSSASNLDTINPAPLQNMAQSSNGTIKSLHTNSSMPSLMGGSVASSEAESALGGGIKLTQGFGNMAAGGFLAAGSIISGLVQPLIQEKQNEKFANFQLNLSKGVAKTTGMPLSNVLGFGSAAPPSKQMLGGLTTRTTHGQGLDLPKYIGSQDQMISGYGNFW